MNIIKKKINGNEQYRYIMTGFHRFRTMFCRHMIAGFHRFRIMFRRHMIAGLCGFLMLLQGRSASADLIDAGGGITYSNAPGEPWMETAVIIIVGLMFILAIGAIVFLHHQKKQEEQERMQREEAEKNEKS